MFSSKTIRFRLIATLSLLGVINVVTGLSGLYGMQNGNSHLKDVNANTMPSAVNIAKSQLTLSRARLALDRVTLHPDAPDAGKTLARAEGFLADSDKAWAAYLALPQDAEEKKLSDRMDADRKDFLSGAIVPLMAALRAQDAAGADKIVMKTMQPLFSKLTDSADALTAFQDTSNIKAYDNGQVMYSKLLWLTMGALGIGVLMLLVGCVSLLRSILRPIGDAINHFQHIADGDLSNRIDTSGRDEMGVLMQGLAAMQVKLAGTVRSVRDGTAAIASATSEIATGNMDLSRRTEQQAASLEMTASSLEELTATVKQNSENARQSNQLARTASEVAVRGGGVVTDVVNTMEAIRTASTRIGDIIGVIDGIAFQTNILALNAAVEAARAGEQGRGFAVVASEVRSLAHRSAEAAKDIKALIGDSVTKVDSGAVLVGQAGATMTEVVASIQKVTEIMAEISDAGREQEIGIAQINQAVAELDATTQQNAALVEEAAAASASLEEQAGALADVVGAFKLDQQAAARHGSSAPRPARHLALAAA
jgi:methyl-accepting chemotaxis protein